MFSKHHRGTCQSTVSTVGLPAKIWGTIRSSKPQRGNLFGQTPVSTVGSGAVSVLLVLQTSKGERLGQTPVSTIGSGAVSVL